MRSTFRALARVSRPCVCPPPTTLAAMYTLPVRSVTIAQVSRDFYSMSIIIIILLARADRTNILPIFGQVKSLRERTGAGIKDVKWALDTAEAELGVDAVLDDRAIELLRKKGVATANKKAGTYPYD
jgi:hypothetical protein